VVALVEDSAGGMDASMGAFVRPVDSGVFRADPGGAAHVTSCPGMDGVDGRLGRSC
jgi:hypothetical protein